MTGSNLTVTAAAALLGVTPQRVRALIKAGILEAEKFGRDWQIDAESVERRKKAMEQKKREVKGMETIVTVSVDYEYPSEEFWQNVQAHADSGHKVAKLIAGTSDSWEFPAKVAKKVREYAETVQGWVEGEEPLIFNDK